MAWTSIRQVVYIRRNISGLIDKIINIFCSYSTIFAAELIVLFNQIRQSCKGRYFCVLCNLIAFKLN